MGGKKHPQRTKNNVKPSNSLRSVQFLMDKNETLKPILTCNYFTDLKKIENGEFQESSDVDPDFLLSFKKMRKTDINTKLNGLKSFMELMETKDKSTVTKNILQQWVLFYCEFVMDFDNRIREMAQVAHKIVMIQIKKNFAPFLKQIIGQWFLAQHDTSSAVANAAVSAFKVVFNDSKSVEAVKLYQNQILNVIYEKLYEKLNINALNKNMKSEELDAIKQKTITTCLYAYAKYLSLLDEKCISENVKNKDFISHLEFWKFSNHKNLIIKAGWFSIAEVLCDKHVGLLDSTQQTTFIKTVINNFDICDSMIIQHVWKCFLIMTQKFSNWIELINLKKSFLPKLWKVLREITTLQTNGVLIMYSILLDVIKQIPDNIFKDLDFIKSFFLNFNIGLKNNTVFKFNNEYANVAFVTYRNSIEFFFKFLSKEHQLEFLNEFIVPVIQWSLITTNSRTEILYKQLKELITNWHCNEEQLQLAERLYMMLNDFMQLVFESTDEKQIDQLRIFVTIIKECDSCTNIYDEFGVKLFEAIVKQPNAKFIELLANYLISNEDSNRISKLNDLIFSDCKLFLNTILKWNALLDINREKLAIVLLQLLQSTNSKYSQQFFKMFSGMLLKNLNNFQIMELALTLSTIIFEQNKPDLTWISDRFLLRLLENDIIDDKKVCFFRSLFQRSDYEIKYDQLSKIVDKIIEEIHKSSKLDKYQEITWILLKPILESSYDNVNFNYLIVELYVLSFENAYEVDRSNNLQKIDNNAQLYNEFLRNSVDMLKSSTNSSNIILRYSNNLKDTLEDLVYLIIMSEFLLKKKLSKLPTFHDIEFIKTIPIKYQQKIITNKNEFYHNLEIVLFTTLYFVDLYNIDSNIFSCDDLVSDFHLIINYLKLFLDNCCDNRFHWLWSSHVAFLEKHVLVENLEKYSDHLNTIIANNTISSIDEIQNEICEKIRSKSAIEDVLKNVNFNQNSIDELIYSVNFLSLLFKDHMNIYADILISYWIKWYDVLNSNVRIDLIIFYEQCSNYGLEAMQFSKQKSNELLHLAKKLLKLNRNVFQVLGRKILTNLIPDFVERDRKQLEANENITLSFLNNFMTTLDGFQIKVEEIFINSELSKSFIQIRPYDEINDRCKFEHIWGYLLLVDSILEILRLSPNNLRLKYIEQLKKIDFFARFLYSVFYLMPEDLLNLDSYRIRREKTEALFIKKPDIKVNDLYQNNLSENFACWLYCQSLIGCGASVREWWIDCSNQKVKNLIEKITTACCSSFVFKKETKAITEQENRLDNVDIKVSAVTREITSTYTFEDLKMDLIIKLPHNYPLGNCQVELSQKIDGDKTVKNSIKQLVMFLSYRNGNIYEAIQMWKMNLDKKLSGIDECYICFSVAHMSSYELPKMCCSNCHKKFHSLCLYKWFSTSNNSTCPICRSHF